MSPDNKILYSITIEIPNRFGPAVFYQSTVESSFSETRVMLAATKHAETANNY
jgi:hypothetical protein